ncbi:MAG: 16S rRNA (uracil(1498)-N(3))-methyltransferase, partial [Pseudomonadota bacterium]
MKTRLFVSAALGNGVQLTLDGEPARYLGRALRLRPGDSVAVFNGDGGEWQATIEAFSRNEVVLSVDHALEPISESPLDVHLVQGISRGDRMDTVVQKATELGVTRITPVTTNHGMVKFDARRAERRTEHWHAVATSAAEQSGRARIPVIDAPRALNDWFGEASGSIGNGLVLTPGAGTPMASRADPAGRLCLLIGPEGGLSERECDDAIVA